jgi:hypothetical protein
MTADTSGIPSEDIEPTAFAPTRMVGGGKGGVGKSMTALALAYIFERAAKPFHLVEADTSNPDVAKAYGNSSSSVVNLSLLDLSREDGWLDLLNLRTMHPEQTIILSTASASNLAIEQFGPLLDAGLKELGAPLVTIWMIDDKRDCLELLGQYRETIAYGRFYVVRNAHCARSFDLYDKSELRREIEAAGGRSLTLPDLSERVALAVNANRLSLTAAEKSTELLFGHKIALRKWLQSVSATLAEVAA